MLWKWTLNRESQSWLTNLNLALGSLVAHRGPCQLRSSSMIWLFKGTWEDSESRLSHSPLNPWIGKFCSCPSVANLPRLTQFHYWSAGNETIFFLHGKIPCGLLWRLKWPLKGSAGFKFEAWYHLKTLWIPWPSHYNFPHPRLLSIFFFVCCPCYLAFSSCVCCNVYMLILWINSLIIYFYFYDC